MYRLTSRKNWRYHIVNEKSQFMHSAHCMSLRADTFSVRSFVNVEIKSKLLRKKHMSREKPYLRERKHIVEMSRFSMSLFILSLTASN